MSTISKIPTNPTRGPWWVQLAVLTTGLGVSLALVLAFAEPIMHRIADTTVVSEPDYTCDGCGFTRLLPVLFAGTVMLGGVGATWVYRWVQMKRQGGESEP